MFEQTKELLKSGLISSPNIGLLNAVSRIAPLKLGFGEIIMKSLPCFSKQIHTACFHSRPI